MLGQGAVLFAKWLPAAKERIIVGDRHQRLAGEQPAGEGLGMPQCPAGVIDQQHAADVEGVASEKGQVLGREDEARLIAAEIEQGRLLPGVALRREVTDPDGDRQAISGDGHPPTEFTQEIRGRHGIRLIPAMAAMIHHDEADGTAFDPRPIAAAFAVAAAARHLGRRHLAGLFREIELQLLGLVDADRAEGVDHQLALLDLDDLDLLLRFGL